MPAQRFFAALLLALSLSPAVQAATPVVWEIQSPAAMTFDEVGRLQDTVLRQWQQVQAAYRPVDRNAIQPLLTQAGQILQGGVATAPEKLRDAHTALLNAQILMMPSRTVELRGALIDADLIQPNADAIGKLLDKLQAAGFNAIFPEVFRRGYALYPNRVAEVEPRYAKSGIDVMRVLTEQAKARNMQVYPWLWAFRVFSPSLSTDNPVSARLPALAAQPMKPVPSNDTGEGLEDESKSFMSPASQEWRELLITMATDLARTYPIQGILLDYVRYGNNQTEDQLSYSLFQMDYFRRVGNFPPKQIDPASDLATEWHFWREEQVHRLVQNMQLKLSSVRNNLGLGAAVFRNEANARNTKMQNWRHWANNNWMRFIAPMMYAQNAEQLDMWLDWETDNGRRNDMLYPILGAHQWRTPGEGFRQISLLQERHIPGVAVFAVRQLNDDTLKRLKTGPFRRSATVPHANLSGAVRQQLQDTATWLTDLMQPAPEAPPFPHTAALGPFVTRLNTTLELLKGALSPDELQSRLLQLQESLESLTVPSALSTEIAAQLDYALSLNQALRQYSSTQFQAPTRPPSAVLPEARPLPSVNVPWLEQAPIIDGELSDPAWQKSALIPQLFWSSGAARPQANTQIRLGYDAQALYVAYRNAEPRMDRLRFNYRIDNNEQLAQQGDDTVELFLSPGNTPKNYYYFVLNPLNTRFRKASFDTSWQGEWTSATQRGDSTWSAEVQIPFSSLRVPAPLQGGSWRGNLCRRRPQEIVPYHCWSFTFSGVHRIDRFGTLQFLPKPSPSPSPSPNPPTP